MKENNLYQFFIESAQVEFCLTLVVKNFKLFYKTPMIQKIESIQYHLFIIFDLLFNNFNKLGKKNVLYKFE